MHSRRDETTLVHGKPLEDACHQRAPQEQNRTFLMSQNRTLLKSPDIICRGYFEMSGFELFRNVGFLGCKSHCKSSFLHRGCPFSRGTQDRRIELLARQLALRAGTDLAFFWPRRLTLIRARG
jgi:hypothetical protein